MIENLLRSHPTASLGHPRARLLIQASAAIFLSSLLIYVFEGGKGEFLMAAVLGAICIGWIILRPHWGVLIILAAWFIQIDALAGIPYVISAILVIPLGLTILHSRQVWLFKVPQIRIFVVIGLLFLVSTWWSEFKYPVTLFPEEDETVRQTQVFFVRLAFLTFFLYFITTRQRIELTVWWVLGLVALTAITAIVPIFTGEETTKRAAAAFGRARNSNYLAFISVFGASLLWFFFSHNSIRRWKALTSLTLPLLFLLAVTALATGSRSGLLQMAVLLAFILMQQERWSRAKRLRSLIFLGFVVFAIAIAIPTAQFLRATSFDPSVVAPGQASLLRRIDTFFTAFDIIYSNPLLGVGIGNSRWIHQAFYGGEREAHNSYLWALSSGGIGTLALYLLLFFITYRMLRKLERAGPPEFLWLSKALRANLLIFLVFSAFGDFWLSEFLYLIVGLTVAMSQLSQLQIQRLGSVTGDHSKLGSSDSLTALSNPVQAGPILR
jgi:O-antigen ligase